jgi:hypothetical protein
MTTSKYLQDPVFLAAVERLKAGTATRQDLANEWGVNLPSVSRRLKYAGLLDELKATKVSGKRDNGHRFTADPDNVNRFDQALAELKANPRLSIRKVHLRHPHLHYPTLCKRAREQGVV